MDKIDSLKDLYEAQAMAKLKIEVSQQALLGQFSLLQDQLNTSTLIKKAALPLASMAATLILTSKKSPFSLSSQTTQERTASHDWLSWIKSGLEIVKIINLFTVDSPPNDESPLS